MVVTITHAGSCAGGGHTDVSVTIDGGPARLFHLSTDLMCEPMTEDELGTALVSLIRGCCMGMTREAIKNEMQIGVTVTI